MDIVEELRQNRESGAERLVCEYKAGLMVVARRFFRNESDAEEAVNATFAKVVENIDVFLEKSSLFTWMCQILVNEFRTSVRRRSNDMEVMPGDLPDVPDEDAQEEIFRNLDHSLLREAVNDLPDEQREAVVLHYFMDMPVAKIAKFLSVPNGTVFSRLHYARKALAAKLGVKAHEAIKKPGVKATLIALALCATAALGAAGVAAFHAATNAQCTMHNAQCAPLGGPRFVAAAIGKTGGTGETSGVSPVSPVSPVPPDSPVPPVPDVPFIPDVQSTTLSKEQTMNTTTLRTLAASAAFGAATAATYVNAADYTWMANPANADWNTSALNWNSGEAWVDDASAPNNAVFPSTSSQKTISIPSGETRRVNNLAVIGASYTIQGDGKLNLAGTFSISNNCTLNAAFDCPTVRFGGPSGKKLEFKSKTTSNAQTATYVNGSVVLQLYSDKSFGPQPMVPTDNIFITGGNPALVFEAVWATTFNQNRIIRISPNASLRLGGNTGNTSTNTIKCLILADNSPGLTFSTNTYVSIPSDWTSMRVFDPGEGRTNILGRLNIASRLKIASGVTRLGSAKSETGSSAMLYVNGNGSGYGNLKGNLEVAGGTLYASQSRYVDVSNYGQVTVKDGGKVYMPSVTWLNGHAGRGKLTVANGEFTVSTLRISQANYSEVHLEEGGLIAAYVLAIETGSTPQGLFRFNGGRLQARDGTNRGSDFISSATNDKWNNVKFGVGEGGAVFDTSNGQNIWWRRPLESDAEHDGGVKKLGGGKLVLRNANSYNGVTHVVDGGLELRADNALPPGSTLRLGGSGAYISANTDTSESPARDTQQWLNRVEGSGTLDNCSELHVTNSIAPAVDGILEFGATCDLRGDYEVSGNASSCSRLEVAAGQDISGLTLKVADFSAFDTNAKSGAYTILDAPGGFTGQFQIPAGWPEDWRVRYTSDSVCISQRKPLVISFR